MTSVEKKQTTDGLTETELVSFLREELAELRQELSHERHTLNHEKEIAERVHRSLLPIAVRHQSIDVDVRHLSVEPLGNDYCQVRIPQDDPLACYISMCHVEGRGIASALLASRISSEARHLIEGLFGPADMVHSLNMFIYEYFHELDIRSSFMATRIDLTQRTVCFSGADHPGGLLLRPNQGLAQRLASQHSSIGRGPDILYGDSQTMIGLKNGDRLLFFAAGITQNVNSAGQALGQSGLATIAASTLSLGVFEMLDELIEQVKKHCGGPLQYDTTLVAVEIK
ncbi:PP2C family protein-serine/threonine phosphatase [Adhaeretor mobilis]|uniref:Stage II sporulation protein E (SpoIIE) n=1 Tax=Adhaeretor mobilis TaxID=1930276 RepID=A0A517N0V1_9BACT|nr:PP2C family protein-serine/threonine phosphatase [Adhaeretor mobilis]QDT00744.1 Stage II sporulation protein E (SpoIIE) [Adhaeretor mobilis]